MKFCKSLLFLIIIIFPFGQLTRLPLAIPEVNIYLQDILVFLLVFGWLFCHLNRKLTWQKPPLAKAICIFAITAELSILVNLTNLNLREIIVANLYFVRWLAFVGVYFVISDLVKLRYINISKWKWVLIFSGTTAAVFGLIQYFLYPDLRNLAYLGWDPHKFRVFGTFFDPSFLGMILVLTLILLIDLIMRVKKIANLLTDKLVVCCILYVVCYVTLALTYSRSSYLSYLTAMTIISWFKKSLKFFLIIIMIGILTILFLPRPPESEGVKLEREESVWGRLANWQQSLTIFKDRPILGSGFGAYRYQQKTYGFLEEKTWQTSHSGAGADSSFLYVLATTGIVGFIAYGYLFFRAVIIHRSSSIILTSLGAIFIHSWFSNSLFYPWVMLWIWILLGIEGFRIVIKD